MCGTNNTDENKPPSWKVFAEFKGICDTVFGAPIGNSKIGFRLVGKNAYLVDLELNEVVFETVATSKSEKNYLKNVKKCYHERLIAASKVREFHSEVADDASEIAPFANETANSETSANKMADDGRNRNECVSCMIL